MFKRGQVVRLRASKQKGIVLAATDLVVIVCAFPASSASRLDPKRKARILKPLPGALDVIGTTKRVPAACTDALMASVKKRRR